MALSTLLPPFMDPAVDPALLASGNPLQPQPRSLPPALTANLTGAPGFMVAGAQDPVDAQAQPGAGQGILAQAGAPVPADPNQLTPYIHARDEVGPASEKGGFWRGLGRAALAWSMGGVPGMLSELSGRSREARNDAKVARKEAVYQHQQDQADAQGDREYKRGAQERDVAKDNLALQGAQQSLDLAAKGKFHNANVNSPGEYNDVTGEYKANPAYTPKQAAQKGVKTTWVLDPDGQTQHEIVIDPVTGKPTGEVTGGTKLASNNSTAPPAYEPGAMDAWRAKGKDLDKQIADTSAQIAKANPGMSRKARDKFNLEHPAEAQQLAALEAHQKDLERQKATHDREDRPEKVAQPRGRRPAGGGKGAKGSTQVAAEPDAQTAQTARARAKYQEALDRVRAAGDKDREAKILATAKAKGIQVQ